MKIPRGIRTIGAAVALAATMPAYGQSLTEVDGIDAREVVSDRELDSMRGGIDMGNGEILFRFEWIVDGVVKTTPVLSATGQTISPASLQRFMELYGSGTGITQPGTSTNAIAQPIIQNSLDGITIDASTKMNAAIFNLSRNNVSPILTRQLIQSLR